MGGERSIHLEVVTPEGELFHDDVAMVVLPGVEGEAGILPGHEPFVFLLGIGETRIVGLDGATTTWPRASATLRCAPAGCCSSSTTASAPVPSTCAAPKRRLDRAQQRLQERGDPGDQAEVDYFRAEQALKRAQNRLRVAARLR